MVNMDVESGCNVAVTSFRKFEAGALKGFAAVELSLNGGIIAINDIKVFDTGNERGPWINMPSKQRLNKDKTPMLDKKQKAIYDPIVTLSEDLNQSVQIAVIESYRGGGTSAGSLTTQKPGLNVSSSEVSKEEDPF